MRRIGKKYRKVESQQEIDQRQDHVNTLQDNVNYGQNVALIVYGILLFGIFALAGYYGLVNCNG